MAKTIDTTCKQFAHSPIAPAVRGKILDESVYAFAMVYSITTLLLANCPNGTLRQQETAFCARSINNVHGRNLPKYEIISN